MKCNGLCCVNKNQMSKTSACMHMMKSCMFIHTHTHSERGEINSSVKGEISSSTTLEIEDQSESFILTHSHRHIRSIMHNIPKSMCSGAGVCLQNLY